MNNGRPPSGHQHTITHGDQVATIVEVGGGLRGYRINGAQGREVVDGYDLTAMCDGARGQTLIPWPNRVKDGSWTWAGVDRQLSLTEPAQHNAIHGLLRWASWTLADQRPDSVTMAVTCHPQPGYPWTLDVTNRWSLDDDGLGVETRIVNRSNDPVPVGAGFHPYLTVGTATVDDATLSVPAATWLPTGDQQIPTGRQSVDGTPFDFRAPRRVGPVEIDHTFTDLQRDDDGRFRLTLSSDDGTTTQLWLDESYPFVEVFTGDSLPDPHRRRQGLGVEPMTAPPNALATGDSLVVLEPGEEWRGRWGITSVLR